MCTLLLQMIIAEVIVGTVLLVEFHKCVIFVQKLLKWSELLLLGC